jgi:SAM-dependent methyltransferase
LAISTGIGSVMSDYTRPIVSPLQGLQRWTEAPPMNPSRVHLRAWLERAATSMPSQALVLDAGAGTSPYRNLFADARYESADFKRYRRRQTYVCDLTAIPVEDARFDVAICTQVLEHVPDPAAVLAELHRVLKPGATLWLSAPLFYAEHQQPQDFFRYTQFALRHLADETGFEVRALERLEGYDATLSYQLAMAARELSPRLLPVRLLFALLARWFACRDVRRPDRDRGMCKNYAAVLVRPTA